MIGGSNMSKWLNKILYVIVAFATAACVFLYISNQSLEHDNTIKDNTITSLNVEIKDYKYKLLVEKTLNKELDDALVRLTQSKEVLDANKEDTIKKIDEYSRGKNNENGNKENNNGSAGSPLDPELAGMLSELCERVRGSPCPNP